MRVAADDRHPRLSQPKLRPDHVDNSLPRITHWMEPDTELGAILREHRYLLRRDRVRDWQIDVDGRHIVIRSPDGEVRATNGPARHAQAVERLGRCHLMDQMQVDVEQVGFAKRGSNDMLLPDLVGQCPRVIGHQYSQSSLMSSGMSTIQQ